MKVSRPVHLKVSLPVSQFDSERKPKQSRRQPAPGPYLARSGSVYLFQIKVPKEIAAPSPLIRISIGPRSHREARAIADLSAAEARLLFARARRRRVTEEFTEQQNGQKDQIFTGESQGLCGSQSFGRSGDQTAARYSLQDRRDVTGCPAAGG
jgi:hypothetical protein